MNQKLIKNMKRSLLSAMMIACTIGMAGGTLVCPLKAATNAEVAQSQAQQTTLSIESFSQNQQGAVTLVCNLERAAGIPKGTTHVDFTDDIKFTVDGKQYLLGLTTAEVPFKSISVTRGRVKILGICLTAEGDGTADFSQLKGKTAVVTMTDVMYVKQYTSLNSQFIKALKGAASETGVPFEQGNLAVNYDEQISAAKAKNDLKKVSLLETKKERELKERPSHVLTECGENIPMTKDLPTCTLDHAGFVDGKLHIRLKKSSDISFNLMISAGGSADMKNDKGGYILNDPKNQTTYLTYDIKDAASLKNSQYKLDLTQTLVRDTKVSQASCVLQ